MVCLSTACPRTAENMRENGKSPWKPAEILIISRIQCNNIQMLGPTRLAETHLAECYIWPNTIGRKPQLPDATIGRMEQLAEKYYHIQKRI
jgi:hypothetical protein